MGGQRNPFGLEQQEIVSLAIERQKLELDNLCEQQSWHQLQAQTLTSLIDHTKTGNKVLLHVSGLQIAKQLDSWEDIVTVTITVVVDSVSHVLL